MVPRRPDPGLRRDGTLAWWEDGRLVGARQAHPEWLVALAFSPDGRWLATGATDGVLQVWDVAAQEPFAAFQDQLDRFSVRTDAHWITWLAWSSAGDEVAVGGMDGAVHVYDVRPDGPAPRPGGRRTP